MIPIYKKRFEELEFQAELVLKTKQNKYSEYLGNFESIDDELFLNWRVKVKNLIFNTCGETSQHFKEFAKAEEPKPYQSNFDQFRRTKAVFLAAKEDYEGGQMNSMKYLVQAEIFDNEIEQASELLNSGYYSASAVIAGVVLETALRDLCRTHSLPISKLDKMNADLAKAGIINKLNQKKITSLADIRNNAAHGNTTAFTKNDVEKMIIDIQDFLAIL